MHPFSWLTRCELGHILKCCLLTDGLAGCCCPAVWNSENIVKAHQSKTGIKIADRDATMLYIANTRRVKATRTTTAYWGLAF